MFRLLKWLLGLAAAAYLLVVALAYAFQERLIFHPRVLPADYAYDWGREEMIDVGDGVELSTVWVDKPDERGVVLYFHGNVGDNNRGRYQLRPILDLPYDVVSVDYRGFGKSTGAPSSDQQLLDDVQAVYDRVKADYPEDRIHLLGYSLGSGMAAYLAANNAPAHLTLVAPYTSLDDMKDEVFWWLPDGLLKYHLDTESRIGDIDVDIDIYHGTADRLIPFQMAETLARLSPKHVTLPPLEGVGHRGAILSMGTEWLE